MRKIERLDMDRSDIKVFSDSVSIGRWHYTKPLLQPTENGEIVFILQSCFGPCKCWKWSMDAQGKFWIEYEWCENDFYKDDNFRK